MGNRRSRKACVGALLAAVLLLTWPGSLPSAASVPTLIVPGEALGPARIGMSLAELVAVLGSSVPEADGQVRFPLWAVTATLQNDMAVKLSTTNPLFRTRSGAGVGTALSQAARLIGDPNFVSTANGSGTTSLYPFYGIGLIFGPTSVAEVYVVERIELSPRKPPAPLAQVLLQAPQPQGSEIRRAAPDVAIRDLNEAVDATAGLFRVMGRVVNIGSQPATAVRVTAMFERINGEDGWKQLVLSQPIAAGADAPFSLETSVNRTIIARYTIEVTASARKNVSTPVKVARVVPPAVYAEFARQVIQVALEQGPPSNTTRAPAVQVLVSIIGTGPIPRAWVKDVRVEIARNIPQGSQEVHLVPGLTQTILVLGQGPVVTATVSNRPGFIPLGPAASLDVTPVIREVLLGTP
jgi:hypothetical protein